MYGHMNVKFEIGLVQLYNRGNSQAFSGIISTMAREDETWINYETKRCPLLLSYKSELMSVLFEANQQNNCLLTADSVQHLLH